MEFKFSKKGVWIAIPIPKRLWQKDDGSIDEGFEIPSGVYNLYLNIPFEGSVAEALQNLIGTNVGSYDNPIYILDIGVRNEKLFVQIKVGDPALVTVIALLSALGIAGLGIGYLLAKVERVVYISYPVLLFGGYYLVRKLR